MGFLNNTKARKDSASSTSSTSTFKYDALDYSRGAIRLLRILPNLSPTGLVQCEIWHGKVSAAYNCLSYVWGSMDNPQDIVINGKAKKVGKNLHDFLRVARMKYAVPVRTFWIDALCIDQDSVEEKNHQVAQMGMIYSNAIEVISWLGFSQPIGRAFTLENHEPIPQDRKALLKVANTWWWNRNKTTNYQFRRDWIEVVNAQYWKRAWITQEILLSRTLKLLVNDTEIDARQFTIMLPVLRFINEIDPDRYGQDWHPGFRLFVTYLEAMCGKAPIRKARLIDLFHQLPKRQCQNPRDRIYSLLSIASDASRIPIDYGIPDTEVLLGVLAAFKKSLCLCFWLYMINAFEYPSFGSKMPVFEIPIRIATFEDHNMSCSACHAEIPPQEYNGHLFCLNRFCVCLRDVTHFYLRRYKTKSGERYTVQKQRGAPELDVLRVDVPGRRDDIFNFKELVIDEEGEVPLSEKAFGIHLTADVLTQLLQHGPSRDSSDVPLQICDHARRDSGRVIYHGTICQQSSRMTEVQSTNSIVGGRKDVPMKTSGFSTKVKR